MTTDILRGHAIDQPGAHLQRCRIGREQPLNGGERLRCSAGTLRVISPATILRGGQMVLSSVATPFLVAKAAHDARQEREQRHAWRPRPGTRQRAQYRLMQQVGPRHTVGEGVGAQSRDGAQPQQIFLLQRSQRRAHVPPQPDGILALFLNLL